MNITIRKNFLPIILFLLVSSLLAVDSKPPGPNREVVNPKNGDDLFKTGWRFGTTAQYLSAYYTFENGVIKYAIYNSHTEDVAFELKVTDPRSGEISSRIKPNSILYLSFREFHRKGEEPRPGSEFNGNPFMSFRFIRSIKPR